MRLLKKLTATASDSDGTIAQVELLRDGTAIATLTNPPYTHTLNNVAVGSYVFSARATDNLGAMTHSIGATVTVNAAASQLYFIHADHLNTPRAITNSTGQLVWSWANDDPFGGNAPNENPSGAGQFTCNLRLPGQYFDKGSGLLYNYHRWFEPGLGRYIQSDPIGLAGGINSYAYVASNPLTRIDPLGLCPCKGGIWDEEAGFSDWQLSLAFGAYGSIGRVNFTCRSDDTLKCTAKVACLGGGLIYGVGLSWNLKGVVHGAPDSRDLAGWSGPQFVWSVPGGGTQGSWGVPGGNTGAGPGGGAGFAAYVRCNTFALKCNCRDCGDK